MLQTIKPSEMCGIRQPISYGHAEQVQLRRASTIQISNQLGRPLSTIEIRARPSIDHMKSPVLRHRQSYNIDQYSRGSYIRTDNDTPPPLPQLTSISPTTQLPRNNNNHTRSSSKSFDFKKKRNAVLSFLAIREPSTPASEEYGRQQSGNSRTRTTTYNSGEASSRRIPRCQNHRLERQLSAETQSSFNSANTSRRRSQHRPTVSMFVNGPPETKLTIGSLSSRPQSLAIQRPIPSAWTPSTSSSEKSVQLAGHGVQDRRSTYIRQASSHQEPVSIDQPLPSSFQSQRPTSASSEGFSTIDPSFVHEFNRSGIAAYILNASHEDLTSDLARRSVDTLVNNTAPTVSQNNRTVWYSDTDADDTPGETTPGLVQPPEGFSWQSEQPAQDNLSIEQENWPLPACQSSLYAPFAQPEMHTTPRRDSGRKISHSSTLSGGTTSSVATVTSPVFSEGLTDSTSPSSSHTSPALDRPPTPPPLLKPQPQSDAASIAPSEISAQWMQSPQQRLGLGGIVVKKATTTPWDVEQPIIHTHIPISRIVRSQSRSNRFSALMKWR